MIDLKVGMKTKRTTNYEVQLTGEQIADLLSQELSAQGVSEQPRKGTNVKVYVSVPGGGDYSSTDLDIDDDCTITVEWQETEEYET